MVMAIKKDELSKLVRQNNKYYEALKKISENEILGKDSETGKTAISYNGKIALKGLGIFNSKEYIVYGFNEIIDDVIFEKGVKRSEE